MKNILSKNLFHEWNDKLEILTRICDYYSYTFRFYSDGRLILQTMNTNTKDDDSTWRGKDDCGHLEYPSIDAMLIDWLDELKKNEGSYKFEEEIKFIKDLQESNKRVVDYDILKTMTFCVQTVERLLPGWMITKKCVRLTVRNVARN